MWFEVKAKDCRYFLSFDGKADRLQQSDDYESYEIETNVQVDTTLMLDWRFTSFYYLDLLLLLLPLPPRKLYRWV
jgi:hypothetical protein